jgi:prephenate dehydrogenase (NADP+)
MICQTPLFRLWLGIVEFLFFDDHIMEETIETALNDISIRPDDLCFVSCAQSWSECIGHGIMEFYEKKFEDTRNFFESRLVEASKLSGDMIRTITKNIK